jgi:hypothetical protein
VRRGIQPRNAAEQVEPEGGEKFLRTAYDLRLRRQKAGKPSLPSEKYCHCRERYIPAILEEIEEGGHELPQARAGAPLGDEHWDSYPIPPLERMIPACGPQTVLYIKFDESRKSLSGETFSGNR